MVRKVSKAAVLAVSAFMLAFLPACSDDDGSEPGHGADIAVSDVVVTPEKSVVYINEEPKTAKFVATVSPDNAADKTVRWSASGTGNGTLSATTGGSVTFTATTAGSMTLTATAGGQHGDASLIVYMDKYSGEMFKTLSEKEHFVDGMWVRVDEDGIIRIDGAKSDVPATVRQDGEQAKLTVTVGGEDYTLTVNGDKLTLETTAEPVEVTLRKFGTSVADKDLKKYTDFGLNEVLIFKEPITPGDGVFASITATITTKGKAIGVGFVSFRDGAYNDGALDSMAFVTDQSVRYKKDYSITWNGLWDDAVSDRPHQDAADGATYTMTMKIEAKAISVIVTNEETGKSYTYTKKNISSSFNNLFSTDLPLYLAIGGEKKNIGETLDITSVTINTPKVRRGKVVTALDLPTRTEVSYDVNEEKAVHKLIGTGKGRKATIAKDELPSLSEVISLSVAGELSWDSDVQIASTDWQEDGTAVITPTFTFFPVAQDQYAALFSKKVKIIVTDSREVDTSIGDISWFSDIQKVSLAAKNDDSNGLVTGGDAALFYKGTDAITEPDDLEIKTARTIVTGVAYESSSVSFNTGDVVMKYELPFTVGNSAVTLTDFSYAWACSGSGNFNGLVSVLANDGTTLYQQEEVTKGNGDVGIQHISDDTFSVPVPANTAGKVVITIIMNMDNYVKTDKFIIAKTVLDFKK